MTGSIKSRAIPGFGLIGILVAIGAVAIIAVGGYFARNRLVLPKLPRGTACTQEAKQCPDGSYVGRTGPNCEFASCSDVSSLVLETARLYIKEHSVPGLEFDVELVRLLDTWALVKAVPLGMDIDNVMVILEKSNGKWEPRDIGTAFPQWYEKVPELFQQDPKVDTSTWKTYRNEKYGFEMRYTNDWEVRLGRGNEIFLNPVGGFGKFPEISIELYLRSSTDPVALENSIKTGVSQNITVDGVWGRKYSGESELADGSKWSTTRIFIDNTKNIYVISGDNADQVLDQILSTFKFIR